MVKKKVVLLGDGSVGKTSLIRRYVFDMYDDEYVSTIGTKVSSKEIYLGKQDIKLLIWDVLGQAGFTGVQATALSGADGAILVADLTTRSTFENLGRYWVPLLRESAGEIPFIILGNKADLKEKIRLEGAEFVEIAKANSTSSLPTSAKTGMNVEEAFRRIAKAMMQQRMTKGVRREATASARVEVNTLVEGADFLMMDFCTKYGDPDHAMDILRQQFKNAGVDVRSVDKEGLRRVLDLLEGIERDYKGEKQARVNKLFRMRMLRNVLPPGKGGAQRGREKNR